MQLQHSHSRIDLSIISLLYFNILLPKLFTCKEKSNSSKYMEAGWEKAKLPPGSFQRWPIFQQYIYTLFSVISVKSITKTKADWKLIQDLLCTCIHFSYCQSQSIHIMVICTVFNLNFSPPKIIVLGYKLTQVLYLVAVITFLWFIGTVSPHELEAKWHPVWDFWGFFVISL